MNLFLAALALILAAGAAALARRRSAAGAALFQALVVAGCAAGAASAAGVLVSGVPVAASLPASLPGGRLHIGIDLLSAVFLLTVFVVGAACAVFGTHDAAESRRPHGFQQLMFAFLLASIALVFAARSIVVFLGAWEVMAISSYLLIVAHHDDANVRRAGRIYLVVTHTATLALFAMFAVWADGPGPGAGPADWSFAALEARRSAIGKPALTAILALALAGFGFKAGCVPLHLWLPPAHASAPSHVSALMSGIVIKTGIYGLLRVLLLLGGAPAWWGWLVFWIGVVSGVLGVLWALAQHDFKRLLAYHSVENIGIILMGIGIGVLGVARRSPGVAVLGFAGGLLHTVNHAVFKSLLFLGAGAVYRATGTRNMEELGGLARRMPATWLGFAIGAAAIIGVPPLNGFVSEWLVFQGMFQGADSASLRLALAGMPSLAIIGALALACFAKVAGVVFLGEPRAAAASAARERGTGSVLPVLALAAICVGLGVFPAVGLRLVGGAAEALSGDGLAAVPDVVAGAGSITVVAVVALAIIAALWWVRGRLVARNGVRRETTWACGYEAVTPRMQYTASSFAAPLLAIFGRLSGLRLERSAGFLHTHPFDPVLDAFALPVWHAVQRLAVRFRVTQAGRIHVYLLYVMAALLAMLAYLSFAP